MPAKQLNYSEEARRALKRGVDALADAVKITLGPRDLSYYDVRHNNWVSTPGSFHIYVGASSADIRLQLPMRVKAIVDPRAPPAQPPSLLDFF